MTIVENGQVTVPRGTGSRATASRSSLPAYNALVSSARILGFKQSLSPRYDTWQEQIWDYYDRIGAFESAITWKSNTMSRVRLIAAELNLGGDEPTPLEDGPAAEAVMRLAGGTGGQAQLMKQATIHLSVPGEGWLTGETTSPDAEEWTFRSADELRVTLKSYEIRETEENAWRPLGPDSIVVRIWDPHPRYGWKANSAARHAVGTMLELDLVNKRIVAQLVSRLASNGILLYDKGRLSFPPVSAPQDGETPPDPFATLLVDIASQGIKDPMSPAAAIPIPIGFDLQDLTDVNPDALLRHVKIADMVDDKLLLERDNAIKQLATSLDMPAEVLLGLGGMNHWGAWLVEESGVKIHIAPGAELICHGLTVGYLQPYLRATNADLRGPNGGRIVVWYDPSEITVRPDHSSNAITLYDRGEIAGRALRRETGMSESDAPDPKEYQDWLLKFLGRQPQYAATVLAKMGVELGLATAEITDAPEQSSDAAPVGGSDRGLPHTQGDAPPAIDDDTGADSLGTLKKILFALPETHRLELLHEVASAVASTTALHPSDANDNGSVPERPSGWLDVYEPVETRASPVRRDTRLVFRG